MNPILKTLMTQTSVPAKENLVEDAIEANDTADTVDQTQAQANVDFQAELERLKNEQPAEETPVETVDDANAVDTSDEPADTDSQEGETANAEATDQPTDTSEQESSDDNEDEDEDDEQDDEADEEQSAESEDEELESLSEEVEVAQEALRTAAEALAAVVNAHEYGVVKPHHVALFDTALETQYNAISAVSLPAVSRESDMPSSNVDKLRYVAGRVVQFLKEILAKMKEYYGKVKKWIVDFFRAYAEAHGRFESNTNGILKRIQYLKGKEQRNKEEIEELAEKQAITSGALSLDGKALTVETTKEAVDALISLSQGIVYSVSDVGSEGPLTDIVTRMSAEDTLQTIVGSKNALTPAVMFDINGSSSIFSNSLVYRNTKIEKSNYRGMVKFKIKDIIGGNTYSWSLADQEAIDIDELINHNHLYLFKVETQRSNEKLPLLTSLEDCEKVMLMTAPLLKALALFAPIEKMMDSTNNLFVKSHDVMAKVVDLVDIQEADKIKVLMVHSTCQSAFNNLFVKSVTNHVRLLNNTVAALQRWVAESLNIIAPEKS